MLELDPPRTRASELSSAADVVPRGDDAALVAEAVRDRRAFSSLYARYAEPVYRYCYRRLGSREAAEDATSLVFTKALAALPAFRGGSFPAWLFAIAHNVVVNQSRRRPDVALDAVEEREAAAEEAPEQAALAAEQRRTLRTLLAGLPDDQRRVVELRLAGLSGAEIATALGRSVASVKMLQLRALKRMRAAHDHAAIQEKDR